MADELKLTAEDNLLRDVAEHAPNTAVAPQHGIAAMALTLALKYHDINTVQDGVLYQQYKMEGKNMHALHLNHVFETAIKIEEHLMRADKRIAKVMFDMLEEVVKDEPEQEQQEQPTPPEQEEDEETRK